ncbi:MAG: D-alanyl-D-alanine carboxypeptidase [Firmicutes bacterium]|nr:D-alanyl-D-alanine carboxypeptidase [Bacillota bacterium]
MRTRRDVPKIFFIIINFIFACLFYSLVTYMSPPVKAQTTSPTPSTPITAESALLIESTSGTVLFQKDADKQLPPASITKIMTMLLVMEEISQGRLDYNDMVVTSERAMSMGGSQIWLEIGEEMSLENLMKAIAIVSANDASVAVAEHIAGSEEAFAAMMNKRAKELGMTRTNFVNSSGLPHPDHYSTARDIALMSRELLRHPRVHQWFTTWIDYVRDGKNILVNTNRLIKSYDGVDGLKTGFTEEAGYCLAATVERDNLRLISVVLKAPDSTVRFKESSALLDFGFRHFSGIELAKEGQIIAEVEVTRGAVDKVEIITENRLVAIVPRGKEKTVRHDIMLPTKLDAPVIKDQKYGELVALAEGDSIVGKVNLVASQDVPGGNIFRVVFRIAGNLFRSLFRTGTD